MTAEAGPAAHPPKDKAAWDLEAAYDAEIAPLMSQIIAVCKAHRMPMLASFAYGNDVDDDGETRFCTTSLNWPGREVDALHVALREIKRGPLALAFTISTVAAEPLEDGALAPKAGDST